MTFNLDKLNAKKAEMQTKLCAALQNQNEEEIKTSLNEYGEFIAEMVSAEATAGTEKYMDASILSSRGVRQLTNEEKAYYTAFANAAKQSDFKMALTGLKETIPQTIITTVFEDLKKAHPLLSHIDFRNTTGLIKIVYDKSGKTEAVWGDIDATTGAEIAGALGTISTQLYKLMGFATVPNGVLDLGAEYIDRWIRELLVEYIANGLETAIVYGDGKTQPIGMMRDVSDDVSVSGGRYPAKAKTTLTEITPLSINTVLEKLTAAPGQDTGTRDLKDIIFVVNPSDYLLKVSPATTVRTPMGTYVHDIMPYPMTIIPSAALPKGEAVMGMAKRYLCCVGFGKEAKIEYDDSVKFSEDARAYRTKVYATGQPLDDNAFAFLDVSKLKPQNLMVEVVNTPEKPVHTKASGQ